MKTLIKITILSLFLLVGLKSMSQTLGVKAGLNLSTMHVKYSASDGENHQLNPGFHIGPTLEIPINKTLSVETGLLLSSKGFRIKGEHAYLNEFIKQNEKLNLLYLDIPITAKLSFDVGSQQIYGKLGPYFSTGLTGRYNTGLKVEGTQETYELDVGFGSNRDKGDLKRLDFGLISGVGINFNRIQVEVNYSLGLANVNAFKYLNNATKATNRVVEISVAYKFGRS